MFGYDSQEDYFDYQDQVAAERQAYSDRLMEEEGRAAEEEAAYYASLEGGA